MDELFALAVILLVSIGGLWSFLVLVESLIKPSITLWDATIIPFKAIRYLFYLCFLLLKSIYGLVKGKITRKNIAIIAVWISVIVMVFMTLYPPWLRILGSEVKTPIGYGFISHPPGDSRLVEIDTTRLILQYVIVIAPLFGLLYTLKKR